METAKPVMPLFKKMVGILAKVTTVLITAPLYLPPKILKAVQYVALFVGLVKATEQDQKNDE